MSWRPTLAQINELVNPLLNWIHSRRLAEKGQTRDIFPFPSGLTFHPPSRPQRIVEDVPFTSEAHKILVHMASSELVPVLNVAAPCSPMQWSSLRHPGFAMQTGVRYGRPLQALESSPPLPRLPPPQQQPSSEDESDQEDPVAQCTDTSDPLDCDLFAMTTTSLSALTPHLLSSRLTSSTPSMGFFSTTWILMFGRFQALDLLSPYRRHSRFRIGRPPSQPPSRFPLWMPSGTPAAWRWSTSWPRMGIPSTAGVWSPPSRLPFALTALTTR